MSFRDFVSGIFGGGQDRSENKKAEYGGNSNSNVTSSLRPNLRPDNFEAQVARAKQDFQGSDGGGSEAYRRMMEAPEKFSDADLSNVPYFSGPSVSNRPALNKGLSDFFRTIMVDSKKDALTDLRLGLGSLTGGGLPGFQKTMESMGFAGLPKEAYQTAFDNYNKRTEMTRQEVETRMKNAQADSDPLDSFDPCPEGYRTDPVTGMCVPVMDATPEPTVPIPFPDLPSGGGGMTSPVLPLMDYTQPINYTAPRISPPAPQGIAGIPLTPIMV